MMVYLLWVVVVALAIDNFRLRIKVKKTQRKCKKWEGICESHRKEIILKCSREAMRAHWSRCDEDLQ